jgi:hypothetical protein
MSSSTGPSRTISRIALVTAFVFVLAGGTAFGAYVVSSNSQIGPNTVSGHKPPTGKHANIILGSINAKDLASNAVTAPKIAPFAVTNGKVAAGAVSTGKIASGAVTSQKIGTGAVNSNKIGLIPQARAEFTAAQPITNNTFTNLCFDTTVFDNDSIWGGVSACNNTASSTKLTAPVAGVYEINAAIQWDNDSTGIRMLRITKNNSSDLATNQTTAAAFTANSVTTLAKLGAGDFVQAEVLQNSGGTLNALGAPTTNLSMTWVGNG